MVDPPVTFAGGRGAGLEALGTERVGVDFVDSSTVFSTPALGVC